MKKKLKIYHKNIASVPEEQYAMLRKNTFGASDVASLFNVGFKTAEEVIAQKQQKFITDEEKEIGTKPNVKKGKDLEDLILSKYIKETNIPSTKPVDMFEIMPGLTVNFDAVQDEQDIPVEIKFVSSFGGKYWTRSAISKVIDLGINNNPDMTSIETYLKSQAAFYGIPVYYYTQLQTQIMALDAPHGDLCALFDKDWEIQIYKVPKDPYFQLKLKQVQPIYYEMLSGEPIQPPSTPNSTQFEY